MTFGQRTVPIIALAGHLSTLERHEASGINDALAGKLGFDAITSALEEIGFKVGDKISKTEREITRSDDTKIINAYLQGSHEGMRIHMREAFSPKSLDDRPERSMIHLIEQSRYGPGNLYDAFNEEE